MAPANRFPPEIEAALTEAIIDELEVMRANKLPMATSADLRRVAEVLAGEILWGFVITGQRDNTKRGTTLSDGATSTGFKRNGVN